MRWLLLALVAAGCGADLASEDEAGAGAASPELPGSAGELDDVCTRLPTTGPCALACDLERLIADHVPAGTCMSFVCDLRGGGTLTFHACAPSDA